MERTGRRSSRTSAATSLGRASTFLVHHPRPSNGRPYGSGSRSQARVLRPSVSPSMAAASTRIAAHVGPSPSPVYEDASRLPLDLLAPAAARWASTAGRSSRTTPRVRSTVGAQSSVVDTGVFVCPDTVVAALYTTAGGRADLVVTAECTGWLRVREQQTGVIRHQQQLRDGNEASCLAWAPPEAAVPASQQTVVVVGQLSGLLSFYVLVGESLVELTAATCVFHEAPILACVSVRSPVSFSIDAEAEEEATPLLPGQNCLLSVDADGVAALWALDAGEKARGGAAAAGLSVQLLHCSYAASPGLQRHHLSNNSREEGDEAERYADRAVAPPLPCTPPVVVSAASLLDVSVSPCAVFTTHRFVDHPSATSDAEQDEEDDTASAEDGGTETEPYALVYLTDFTTSDAAATPYDLDGTTLAMSTVLVDTVVSSSTDGAAAAPPPPPAHADAPPLRYRWTVLCAYSLPGELRSRAENSSVSIVSLCVVGGSRGGSADGAYAASAAQLWAGTTDGRLFVWLAHTGQFVRCLRSNSATPVHSLSCVPVSGFHAARRRRGEGGDPLVWASQADGGVVAWSAVTFAVVEVLPVSYPPPQPTTAAEDCGGPSVVAVRDAIGLLRATRHQPPTLPTSSTPSSSSPSWSQRRNGFTLFVQPMEVVCMQRAWSVATDDTVRTWLLPAGSAPAFDDDDDDENETERERVHGGSTEDEGLDAYTVQCFLQDKAEAYVREQQVQQMEWAAQQAQLAALRERNEVLAAALQQAIGRLERVGADGLVRSTSPASPHTPPPPPPAPASRDSLKTPDVRDAMSGGDDSGDGAEGPEAGGGEGGERGKDRDPRQVRTEVGQHARTASQGSAASTLSSPSTDSPLRGQLVTTAADPTKADASQSSTPRNVNNSSNNKSNDTQMHVQVLQQLLEELHGKLEESWSRNDGLREELLMYQLRTLEREEDIARRVRETVMHESAVAAAVAVQQSSEEDAARDGDAAAPPIANSAAVPLPLPRPPSTSTLGETQRSALYDAPYDAPPPPQPATAVMTPISQHDSASRLTSPSHAVEAPAMETLVATDSADSDSATATGESRRIPAPRIPSAPPDSRERDAAWSEARTNIHADTTPSISFSFRNPAATAADRFFTAAAEVLRQRRTESEAWEGHTGRSTHGTPLPPIRAPLPMAEDAASDLSNEDVEVETYTTATDEGDGEDPPPALVAAWSTSEGGGLSPITTSTITAPAASQNEDVHYGGGPLRRPTQSSSLFSYPYLSHPNNSSVSSVSYDRSMNGSRNVPPQPPAATATVPTHPVRLYASGWTPPERDDAFAYTRPPSSTALQPDVPSPPGPLPAARVTPRRHAPLPTAASPPRPFRSPIIYHY